MNGDNPENWKEAALKQADEVMKMNNHVHPMFGAILSGPMSGAVADFIEMHGDPGNPDREAEIAAREYQDNHPSLTAEERNR